MRIKSFVAAASIAAFAVTGLGYATNAHAAPWPGWTDGQQMEVRLLAAGVNRQFQPEIIDTADTVCRILRESPDATGKKLAFAALRDAGYYEGYQSGFALGTLVDVKCPDMWHVIR